MAAPPRRGCALVLLGPLDGRRNAGSEPCRARWPARRARGFGLAGWPDPFSTARTWARWTTHPGAKRSWLPRRPGSLESPSPRRFFLRPFPISSGSSVSRIDPGSRREEFSRSNPGPLGTNPAEVFLNSFLRGRPAELITVRFRNFAGLALKPDRLVACAARQEKDDDGSDDGEREPDHLQCSRPYSLILL